MQAVPTPEDPTLAQAISGGDYIEILLAQRREIVETLPDVRGAAKAALHRQLTLISKEIEAIRVSTTQADVFTLAAPLTSPTASPKDATNDPRTIRLGSQVPNHAPNPRGRHHASRPAEPQQFRNSTRPGWRWLFPHRCRGWMRRRRRRSRHWQSVV